MRRKIMKRYNENEEMCEIFEIYFIGNQLLRHQYSYEIEWFIILTICYFKIFTFRAVAYVIFVYFFCNLLFYFFLPIYFPAWNYIKTRYFSQMIFLLFARQILFNEFSIISFPSEDKTDNFVIWYSFKVQRW